ncbi:ABC transporter ATP-binding protein [Mesorhizobium sp. CAU 1732]|uniref:ABC transporter ATP-binding protein n=1 Tax=Mesorhizobium sp. CAU 1732 TaxID=3140358 RepID=UPI0032617E17
MLKVRGLKGGYGGGRLIVDGVDLDVEAGEIVTVIGQNGAGKSTILKTIFNMTPVRDGEIVLDGTDIFSVSPYQMLTVGLAYIPQHHSVFPKLTIAENLRMGGYLLTDNKLLQERTAKVEEMFPILKARRNEFAASLSGGEQRMLEIARTLIMDPKVVMLDEPSIGLAPKMVDIVFSTARRLAEAGKAILMVEQNVKKALMASERGYVLELGQVRIKDDAQALIADERVSRLYMGVRA